MENKLRVTYRQIAKFLCRGLPIEGADFGDRVSEVTQTIEQMPPAQQQALQCAYIFSHKVPRQQREDLFQQLIQAILTSGTEDIKLAYTIARCDWISFWDKYKTRQFYELEFNPDAETADRIGINPVYLERLANKADDMAELVSEVRADVIDRHEQKLLREAFIGEMDFELRQCEKIDAKRIWDGLPDRIKTIAQDRLAGKGMNGADRKYLERFIKSNPMILAQS